MTYKRALFFIFSSLEGSQEGKKGGGLLPPDFSQKIKVRMGILPGSPNIIAPALPQTAREALPARPAWA